MQIPLHLSADDQTMQADMARLEHWTGMMNLNPHGFRNHRSGKHRKAQIDNFHTPVEQIANRVYGAPTPANDNARQKRKKRNVFARMMRRITRRAA